MKLSRLIQGWLRDETGTSFVEFALILPIMLSMLLGMADVGYALVLQRKLVSATQSVADLLTREESLTSAKVADAIRAAELILAPNAAADLSYDVVGIKYRTDNGQPAVSWRSNRGMQPDARLPGLAVGLGAKGEGVIAVVMTYTYRPIFSEFMIGTIPMKETAILRGRKVAAVPYTS